MPQSWQAALDRLRQQTLNLFLKANCPLCDRPADDLLCRYCDRQIQDCQLPQPDRYWQGDLPLFAWGKYDGALKQALGKLKYAGYRSIGERCGEWLAESWQRSQLQIPNPQIVPIPLHPDKLATRGFNQAEAIAQQFVRITGDRLDLSLQRSRSTVAQFGLSKAARQENVAGAFTIAPNSALKPGTTVLLIDDIYTTGATVREAAAVLRARQINVCGVAVVATGRDDR